jgi:hypothetical protein
MNNKVLKLTVISIVLLITILFVTCTPTETTYTITIDPEPTNGSITLDPAEGPYDADTEVTVTAEPDTGYVFDSWGGDLSGSTSPATLTMDADKTITATFVEDVTMYNLTVTDDGNGSVTLDPTGGTYAEGTDVTLTPVPDTDYIFSNWTGADAGDVVDNGDGTYTITMDADKTITATFVEDVTMYNLTVTDDGNGSVTLNPTGGTYAEGTDVTLTPVPDTDYIFSNWTGADAGDLTDNGDGTFTITMDADKTIQANFILITYTLTVNNDGNGSVTLNPTGGTYDAGTDVTLTPVPNTDYVFDSWTGTDAGDVVDNGDGTYTITMDADKSIQANFILITYTLTVNNDGNGSVTLNPTGGTYDVGTDVTLTPVPNTNYLFDSWTGSDAGDVVDNMDGTYTITMDADKTIQANFILITYTLTVNNDGNGSVTLNPTGGTYDAGTDVILTPSPNTNYVFDSWTGTDAGDVVDNMDGTYTITMDADKSIQANFILITYTLTVTDDGNGSVTLNPTGGTYDAGTDVILTPVPNTDYVFSNWTGTDAGDVVDNMDGTYTITMDADKSIQANFTYVATWTSIGNHPDVSPSNIYAADATHIFAAGTNGYVGIYNGTSWTSYRPTTTSFEGIHGSSANNVWAVGYNGTAAHWDGSSWTLIPIPSGKHMYDVYVIDENHVWAVGGQDNYMRIEFYNGSSWTTQMDQYGGNNNPILIEVFALDANNVWAGGSWGYLYKYDGSTWAYQSAGIPSSAHVTGIWGTSASEIYLSTTDGKIYVWDGTTSSEETLPASIWLTDIWGSDANNIWAVGNSGTILHYNGISWIQEISPDSNHLRGVYGIDAANVWAVGYSSFIGRQ